MGKLSRIYLVDDDIDDLELMTYTFTELGIADQLLVFQSCNSLWKHLSGLSKKELPSLFVIDYNMPQVNGLEVLRMLKASEVLKDIPVVIYSTSCTPLMQKEVEELGAVACLQKARDLQDLRKHVLKFQNIIRKDASITA